MKNFLVFLLALSLHHFVIGYRNVNISNTKNIIDTDGNIMITGELDILPFNGVYYMVMTNWGGCNDKSCKSPCVYAGNHTFVMYSTKDFVTFQNHGVIMNATNNAVIFRPHLIYNQKTKLFVLWYTNRETGKYDRNYGVATSRSVLGPYKTVVERASLEKCGGGGDYDLFVDDDLTAYIFLTHYSYLCFEKLDETYTKGVGESQSIVAPKSSEGPVMFKRDGVYYALFGRTCCACTEGSNIFVFTSSTPLGKYTLQSDIGTNKDGSFTTKSQQATVFRTPFVPDGEDKEQEHIWVGNNWGSDLKNHEYNHDLLYFYPLEWSGTGKDQVIEHVKWEDEVTFEV